ncbi:MAG: RNA polymerase sigma-70 factor [Halioglobus sp.]
MPADPFESHRSKLFGIAYRMLGSVAEAEDAVQDTYLRWHQKNDRSDIINSEAFLVTVVTRLCLDHLKSATVNRETYVGPWLPEPLITGSQSGPEAQKEFADTLSYAFLMLLERLNPTERAVYILREAFDFKHEEIAAVLGGNAANSRQVSRRAKANLGQHKQRFECTDKDQDRLFGRFIEATGQGNLQPLFDMLADDIVLYSDGGGKVLAALRPLRGKERIIRFLRRTLGQRDSAGEVSLCRVNGQPAIKQSLHGEVTGIVTLHFVEGKVEQLFVVRNPDKLCRAEYQQSII